MSMISSLGESLVKVGVEVKSALDEALSSMPNQTMKPEDIANGLKGRQVQKLEMQQSGVEANLRDGMFTNPKALQEWTANNRTDKYTTTEFRGMPVPTKVVADPSAYWHGQLAYGGDAADADNYAEIMWRTGINREGVQPLPLDDVNMRHALTLIEEGGAGTVEDADQLRAIMARRAAAADALDMPATADHQAYGNIVDDLNIADVEELNERNLGIVRFNIENNLERLRGGDNAHLGPEGAALAIDSYEQRLATITDIQARGQQAELADDASRTVRFAGLVEEVGDDSEGLSIDNIGTYLDNLDAGIAEGNVIGEVPAGWLDEIYALGGRTPPGGTTDELGQLHNDFSQLITDFDSTIDPDDIPMDMDSLDNLREVVRDNPDVYPPDHWWPRIGTMEDRIRSNIERPLQQPAAPQTETIDAVVPVIDLVNDSQGEFDTIAARYGMASPDANYPEQVEPFLTNIAAMDGLPADDLTHVQNLQGAYGNLAEAINRGDHEITIPNYNTRIVDPDAKVTYEFGEDTYRSYALPDTDDASYAVRIYKNPAVDTKGFRYDSHWSGDDVENGVFHSRTDSPRPDVLRIQELQSDIQNMMTKDKSHAIREWQKGSNVDLIRADHVMGKVGAYSSNPVVSEIRTDINTALVSDFESALPGMSIDPVAQIGEPMHKLLPADMREAMLSKLTGEFFSSPRMMPEGPAKRYIEVLLQDGEWRGQGPVPMEELMSLNPGLTKREINTIIDLVGDVSDDYETIANIKLKHARAAAIKQRQLRVTSKERKDRIIKGETGDLDEMALQEQAMQVAFDSLDDVPGMEDIDLTALHMPSQLSTRMMEAATGLDRSIIVDRLKNTGLRPLDDYDAALKMKNLDSSIGRAFPDLDLPAIRKAHDEASEAYKHHIMANADKDLPALEKFPDASKFQLPVPFMKQGFQEEIVRALNEGKKEVWLTVNPTGTGKLVRGAGPQQNYEPGGSVYKTFKGMAKRFNADLVEEDGYLKMVFKGAAAAGGMLSLSAYADTESQDFIRSAREQGVPDAEIQAYMEETGMSETEQPLWEAQALADGVSQEEIDQYKQEEWLKELSPEEFATPSQLMESDVPTVEGDPTYAKLPPEAVKELALELDVDPTTPNGIDAIYTEAMKRTNPGQLAMDQEKGAESAQQFIADAQELYDVDRPWLRLKSMMGYGEAVAAYQEIEANDAKQIVELGKDMGYDLIYGQGEKVNGYPANMWFVNIEGEIYEATPEFFANTARHFTGEAIGGMAAAKEAERYTRGFDAVPYGKLARWGIISASGIAGAILGDQVDYAAAAAKTQQEMTWDMALQKSIGSAQTGAVGEVVGYSVIKIGAVGIKGVQKAYAFFTDGNIDGAYDMLKQILDVTDQDAEEIVARWEAINGREAPTVNRKWYNPNKGDVAKEKAIAVLPTTRAGGENIISQVTSADPRASAAIASEVNQRAKSLVQATAENVGDKREAAQSVIDGMNQYKLDTESWYDVTKTRGGDLAPKGYQFSIDRMAVKPILDNLAEGIFAPQQRQAAINMLERIDSLTQSRTFEDLIELRQLMNNIRSKGKPNKATIEAFNEAMHTIDNEIEDVAHQMGPEGPQWLTDWTDAKSSYSEMKRLTTSALGRVITRPGINEAVIAKALVKYGTALDGTYTDLVKQLPLDVQPKVEASIINQIVHAHTAGTDELNQAVQFPGVARDLANYEFMWPESKALKKVVDDFAEIYQNDVALAYSSGGISTTKFQSYLTTDPVVRAKYEFASKIFNQFKILMGGPTGDATALVKTASALLEDPLNPTNVKQALKAAQGDAVLEQAIRDLSRESASAQHAGRDQTTKIKMYKGGDGKLYTQPATGRTEAASIPMHRMTNESVARKTVGEGGDLTDLTSVQKARLISKGVTAIGLDDGSVIILH